MLTGDALTSLWARAGVRCTFTAPQFFSSRLPELCFAAGHDDIIYRVMTKDNRRLGHGHANKSVIMGLQPQFAQLSPYIKSAWKDKSSNAHCLKFRESKPQCTSHLCSIWFRRFRHTCIQVFYCNGDILRLCSRV